MRKTFAYLAVAGLLLLGCSSSTPTPDAKATASNSQGSSSTSKQSPVVDDGKKSSGVTTDETKKSNASRSGTGGGLGGIGSDGGNDKSSGGTSSAAGKGPGGTASPSGIGSGNSVKNDKGVIASESKAIPKSSDTTQSDSPAKTNPPDTKAGGIGKTVPKAGTGSIPGIPTISPEILKEMQKVQQLVKDGDTAGGLALLKTVHEREPKQRQLLFSLVQLGQQFGIDLATKQMKESEAFPVLLESAEFARKLKSVAGTPNLAEKGVINQAIYNEACVYAKTSKPDEALKSLEESVDSGFNDLNQIDTDTDIDPLRELEKFKEIRAKVLERNKGKTPAGIEKPAL